MSKLVPVTRQARWSLACLIAVFSAFAGLVAAPKAHAFQGYLTAFNNLYGTATTPLNNCGVCHNNFTTGGGQGGRSNNPYGLAVQNATGADITARLNAVAPLFSDADATNNVGEINLRFCCY